MIPAFEIVAQVYDRGYGVRADSGAALYWYRRAYRHGSDSAANNIWVHLARPEKIEPGNFVVWTSS
jgi:TPR repeat protein